MIKKDRLDRIGGCVTRTIGACALELEVDWQSPHNRATYKETEMVLVADTKDQPLNALYRKETTARRRRLEGARIVLDILPRDFGNPLVGIIKSIAE